MTITSNLIRLMQACLLATCWHLATTPTLAGQAEVPQATEQLQFDGLWDTRYGRVRLVQDGNQVSGTYSSVAGSTIHGEIKGDRLNYRYTEGRNQGEGWFEVSQEGAALIGEWRADHGTRFSPWNGRRVVAEEGKSWLIILEARWETGLHEEEYTFGEMLRSYFTMAPKVEIRERRFHDEADFRRFASEVQYIAEPVVLLISTHGSPAGISVNGHTIGPKVIAESLQSASNLRLLHLSGCDMMRGSAPEAIMDAIPEASRFPISGYTTTVDWAASALSDFTYLTFLLMHGRSPAESVAQTHIASPYTADKPIAGSHFHPLGLKLLAPSDLKLD